MKNNFIMLLIVFIQVASAASCADELEVLHWWTSGGEGRSANVLKQMMEKQGHQWKDFAVAGGGGQGAMRVLQARAVSGNPPTAAQIKGHDIQEWASLGLLVNLDEIATPQMWDTLLPNVVNQRMKYQGHYVAVPVNIHRVNWLWGNPAIFATAQAQPPTTLEEFFIAAEKIKAAGFIPLAHGNDPWQDAVLFESVALAVLGPQTYQKAFVELDMATLSGDKMVEVFTQFKRFKDYIDEDATGRPWHVATDMVMNGVAAMQIMGDWAKGELTVAGKQPGRDYFCLPAPGTANQFSYNIDSFVFFKPYRGATQQGQKDLATMILTREFQTAFNLNKGSLPVRTDMTLEAFDTCAQDAMQTLHKTTDQGTLLPSLSEGMATNRYIQAAIFDVVSLFFNDPTADPKLATTRLARAVHAAM